MGFWNHIFVFSRDYIGGRHYSAKVKLHGKTVIVTGASSGIGKALAENFAERGMSLLVIGS